MTSDLIQITRYLFSIALASIALILTLAFFIILLLVSPLTALILSPLFILGSGFLIKVLSKSWDNFMIHLSSPSWDKLVQENLARERKREQEQKKQEALLSPEDWSLRRLLHVPFPAKNRQKYHQLQETCRAQNIPFKVKHCARLHKPRILLDPHISLKKLKDCCNSLNKEKNLVLQAGLADNKTGFEHIYNFPSPIRCTPKNFFMLCRDLYMLSSIYEDGEEGDGSICELELQKKTNEPLFNPKLQKITDLRRKVLDVLKGRRSSIFS